MQVNLKISLQKRKRKASVVQAGHLLQKHCVGAE